MQQEMCRVTCPGCSSDPGFDLPALPIKFGNETNLALKASAASSLGLADAWFDREAGQQRSFRVTEAIHKTMEPFLM